MNWFRRHLNWTWVFAYLIWFPLNASAIDQPSFTIPSLVGTGFLLVVSIWVIKQKGRRLWWVLLTPAFSPLWLGNKRTEPTPAQKLKMPLIQRARTTSGRFVQILGWILWLGCGFYVAFWQWGIIADAFGWWVGLLALIFFPVAFAAAVPIAWFTTGTFPLHILILWLLSFGGAAMTYAGRRMKGEEIYE